MQKIVSQVASVAAAIGLLAGSFPSIAAENGEPRPLEPSSPWSLNYDEEACTLTRLFGAGADETRFQLVSYGSPSQFRLFIVGPLVATSHHGPGKLNLTIRPDTETRKVGGVYGKNGDLPAVTLAFQFARETSENRASWPTTAMVGSWQEAAASADFERAVDSVVVEFDDGDAIDFRLGDMSKALEAMRTCIATLYKFWKLDPEVQKTLSRSAVPVRSPVRRLQRDYPLWMNELGEGAVVPVRVMVSAEGEATECVVQNDVVDEAFRRTVCKYLMVKYEPALDAVGEPVPTVVQGTIAYLPGG